MTQNKDENIMYFDVNKLYGYEMSTFLPASEFKWIEPEDFDSNKYSSSSLKGCVL